MSQYRPSALKGGPRALLTLSANTDGVESGVDHLGLRRYLDCLSGDLSSPAGVVLKERKVSEESAEAADQAHPQAANGVSNIEVASDPNTLATVHAL